MDYYSISDEKITAELGQRMKRLRQQRGYSKMDVAGAIGQSAETIRELEKGRGSLETFISVLRVLRAFDQLDRFLIATRVKALELREPKSSEGTVTYRRRKSDFRADVDDEPVNTPRRKSDFSNTEESNSDLPIRKKDFIGQV